ncbi:hypothetical protein HJG60_009231 [Phyllostomus discolor]|uniref:Uncharacterized protein n=1 Tax=Phyllostomus discolor TaxID=89673 RepID=A0A834DFV4_9CHIR|nr:hypothetical protein HJG60_009231 [Phyllostomus discolor]
MATDGGSRTNGFWCLGRESLPGQVVGGGTRGTVPGVGAGGGWACGSLPPPPGPCSPQETSPPTPGSGEPQPKTLGRAEMAKGMQKSPSPGPACSKQTLSSATGVPRGRPGTGLSLGTMCCWRSWPYCPPRNLGAQRDSVGTFGHCCCLWPQAGSHRPTA